MFEKQKITDKQIEKNILIISNEMRKKRNFDLYNVAMANFKGGKILLGVDDKSKIKGIKIGKESILKWINEIKNKTYPFLMPMTDIIKIKNKKVLIFTIKESPLKPIAFKNRYFIRKENSNQIMSFEESFNLGLQTIRVKSFNYDTEISLFEPC